MKKWNMKKIIKTLWFVTITSFILTIVSCSVNNDKVSFDEGFGVSFSASKNNKPDSIVTNGKIDSVKQFSLSDIKSLSLSSLSSDINLIPYNKSEVKIHFHGKVSSNNKNTPYLETNLTNGKLIAIIKYPKSLSFFNSTNLDAKLDIYIPEEFSKDIDISTVSGNVNIDNLVSADFSIDSVSGEITVNTLQCSDFSFKTTSGDGEIDSLKCKKSFFSSVSGKLISDSFNSEKFEFKTTSGGINLNEFTGELSGSTVSGSVEIDYKTFDESIDMSTTSGDVDISLPKNSEFSVELNTTSGTMKNDFATKITKSTDRSLYGTIGNSAYKIKVKTTSGDISIKEI